MIPQAKQLADQGSSPLTRGAPDDDRAKAADKGLIPAYAGSTWPVLPHEHRVWAHPRLRGEHAKRIMQEASDEGSSPLTRGAPLLSRNNMSLRAVLHTASSGG